MERVVHVTLDEIDFQSLYQGCYVLITCRTGRKMSECLVTSIKYTIVSLLSSQLPIPSDKFFPALIFFFFPCNSTGKEREGG